MPVYIELFHGRRTPSQQMDDWGEPGPIFGPYPFIHTTYGTELKLGEHHRLDIHCDMVYYDGMYYGDWSVFGAEVFRKTKELRQRHQTYEEAEARLTGRATLRPARLRRRHE